MPTTVHRVSLVALAALLAAPAALAQGVQVNLTDSSTKRWALQDLETVRFPDSDSAGPTWVKDTELELVYTDGDRVRLRLGNEYGWAAASLVTEVRPAHLEAPSPLSGLPPGLQLTPGAPLTLPAPQTGGPTSAGAGGD